MIRNEEKKVEEKNDIEQKEKGVAELLGCLQMTLNKHIEQVRLSDRLGRTPACLVGIRIEYGSQLERPLQNGGGGHRKRRRILELNPNHPIFVKMRERFEKNENEQDTTLSACAELLLGYAVIAEGAKLPDPSRFNRLLAGCILHVL